MIDEAQPDYKSHSGSKINVFLPHGMLPVLYCMKMWCTLRIASKSTRHSAVDLLCAEIAHSPPHAERFVKRPSTALAAPQAISYPGVGYCCHVGLFKAKFSRNENNA